MIKSPCWSREQPNCPRRAMGCAINCPEWQEYTAQREVEYAKRKKEREEKEALNQTYSPVKRLWFREERKKRR